MKTYYVKGDTFEKMRTAAGSILEEGRLGDEVITVNIIDQLVEADRDNYITKIMMKIYY